MLQTKYPRAVGIDHGLRRVGLAISDPLGLFAQAYGTFSPSEAVEELRRLEARDGLAALVMGWPLLPDGEEGPATERAAEYGRRLRNAFPGVPLVQQDERYTSQWARQALFEAGVSRKARRKKGRVDAAAAALILQEYLDGGAEE
jgi:putative Holliday junction resolvase